MIVADDVYMYVRMCLRIYVCMRYARVSPVSASVSVPVSASVRPQCQSNVRHKRFSSVRHCVRRVTGGCYRFWKEKEEQENDDGEKEARREKARRKIIILT